MSSKALFKVLAAAVGAQSIRIKQLEKVNRAKGVDINMDAFKMDSETQKLMDALYAAIDAMDETETADPVASLAVRVKDVSTVPTAKVKTVAPVTISEDAPAKIKKQYADMSVDEMRNRVTKRGGDPEVIMEGKHARARTIALRIWLSQNPPIKADNANNGKAPAKKARKVA